MFGGFLLCEMKMIAGSEKGFARNTSDIEAGAAQLLIFLDQRSLKSELSRANSSDVPAGPGADDYDVKFIHGFLTMSFRAKLRSLLLYREIPRSGPDWRFRPR